MPNYQRPDTKVNFGSKVIYTTGAYLMPVLCADNKWRWSVSTFEDDTFQDGDIFNPAFVSSDNLEDLENTADEMEHPEFYNEEK